MKKQILPPDEYTSRDDLIGMIDDGLLDAREVAIMCVKYMSADDVTDMMNENEIGDNIKCSCRWCL